MLLLLLTACSEPQCDPGFKLNLDGLCIEDTSAPTESTPPDDSNPPDDSDSPADDSDSPASDDSDSTPPASDWEALGGEAGISTVLDTFLANVGSDPIINWMFANTDLLVLKQLLLEQISSVTGGPYSYTGRDMVTAHAGMNISEREWAALVGDLLGAFDSLGVDYSADLSGAYPADRLVIALAGLHDDIVTDPNNEVLFNQLGGHVNLSLVVDELLEEVSLDSRINARFAESDLTALSALLVEQLCDETGGYCTYSGQSMQAAHAGMDITDEEFDALAEDLLAALDNLNVDYTENTFDGAFPADALITALLDMRGDIVGQ
jgi:hemoglobin